MLGGKEYFASKTIIARDGFSMEKLTFLPISWKNLPTLGLSVKFPQESWS